MAADLDLDTSGAAATARAVRDGDVSALEACDAAIARIERLDGAINAVVVRDFDRARAAAKAIDAGRVQGDARPLLGVPMTVKESNDVAGLPTTWGIPVFKDRRVAADGVAVARLKEAGAVILGKTNVPVSLADWQTVNPIYGRTVNPHDHACSPGGSSGGAAAAVACGMVPLELGSDIGGSIRVPAHLCGVFGHKPTYGVIPLKGHSFPGTDGIEVPLAVVGPLARSAADLAVALDVLAGPADSVAWRLDLPAPRHRALADHRVLVLADHPSAATDSTVLAALDTLAQALERSGLHVTRQAPDLPDLAAAHGSYMAMLNTIVTRGAPDAQPIGAHAWMELADEQMRVARRWRAVFAGVDVVLAPAFGVAAFPHEDNPDWGARTLLVDGAATPYAAQLAWPGMVTYPGLPATAVPVGKTTQGLPIGVQVVAGMYEDRTALAFAGMLQQAGLAG